MKKIDKNEKIFSRNINPQDYIILITPKAFMKNEETQGVIEKESRIKGINNLFIQLFNELSSRELLEDYLLDDMKFIIDDYLDNARLIS